MPTCHRCKQDKAVEDFPFRDRGHTRRHSYCYDCGRVYHREWYRNNREAVRKRANQVQRQARVDLRAKLFTYLKEHPCVDCGEADPCTLDFDHVRGQKSLNVADMLTGGYSWGRVQKEIAKCDVRCANCHRRRTAKSLGWYA